MAELCLMLKTYAPDLAYAERLVRSFHDHNVDDLQLYVVVPQMDLPVFRSLGGRNVEIILDEDIPVSYATGVQTDGLDLGFVNAGVSKLGFWELGLCQNYFSIDSDFVFIRPFSTFDFFTVGKDPYVVATEARDLKADPFYFSRYWGGRQSALESVARRLDVLDPTLTSYHTAQMMSSAILRNLKEIQLEKNGLEYVDLMMEVPWEYFWYTTFALHQSEVQIQRRDEMVKVVHHQGEHLALLAMGVSEADLARSYLGVVVNSNWSRQYGLVSFDQAPVVEYRESGHWARWNSARQSGA